MRIERVRMGLEVRNKVDGKMYKITNIGNKGNIAHEMLDDGQLGDDTVTITKDNVLAFKVIRDPEPYPVATGYTVVDGTLYKSGIKVCEQGQLRIEKIVAELPGQLVCAVKSRVAEDRYDLVLYEPAKDTFSYLNYRTIPMPELVAYTKDHTTAFLAFSVIDIEKITNENGVEEEVHTLKDAAVIAINGKRVAFEQSNAPIVIKNIALKEVDGYWTLFVPHAPIKENGERITPGQYLWHEMTHTGIKREMLLPEDVHANWSCYYETFVMKSDELLFVDVDSESITIKHPAIKELADYPVLIDITKEQWTYRLTFANPDTYQLKTLVSRSTRDRGYVVTVE